MKKIRNLIVCLLIVAMTVSLSACSKKPLSEKKFRDIMEDKYDYEIGDAYKGDDVEEHLSASKDAFSTVFYTVYEDKDTAEDEMEDMIDQIEEEKEDGDFEGTIKKSGSGNFKKLVIDGEYTGEIEYETYEIVVRCDDVMIYVNVSLPDKKDIKEANSIIKAFGY